MFASAASFASAVPSFSCSLACFTEDGQLLAVRPSEESESEEKKEDEDRQDSRSDLVLFCSFLAQICVGLSVLATWTSCRAVTSLCSALLFFTVCFLFWSAARRNEERNFFFYAIFKVRLLLYFLRPTVFFYVFVTCCNWGGHL